MYYSTKKPEEAEGTDDGWHAADQLLLPLRGLKGTAQWPRPELWVATPTRVLMKPKNLQDAQHPSAHTIRWHGGMIDEPVINHLRKVIPTHHTDWDESLLLFLLTYTASTHETMGMMLESMVFRRALCQTCNLFSPSSGQGTSHNRHDRPHEMAVTSTIMPIDIWI
jgi:hypothetical protein